MQAPIVCSFVTILYLIADHVVGDQIRASCARAQLSRSQEEAKNVYNFLSRLGKRAKSTRKEKGLEIDAFRPEICGQFSTSRWQQGESAFNCRRRRFISRGETRAANISGRVWNGWAANYGEFPSSVQLSIFKANDRFIYTCTGTLIHRNLVMTASNNNLENGRDSSK